MQEEKCFGNIDKELVEYFISSPGLWEKDWVRESSLNVRQKETLPPLECFLVRTKFLLEQEGAENDQKYNEGKMFVMMNHGFQKAQWKLGIEGGSWI